MPKIPNNNDINVSRIPTSNYLNMTSRIVTTDSFGTISKTSTPIVNKTVNKTVNNNVNKTQNKTVNKAVNKAVNKTVNDTPKIDPELYKQFITTINEPIKTKPFTRRDSNRPYSNRKGNKLQAKETRKVSITNNVTKQSLLKGNNTRVINQKNPRYGKNTRLRNLKTRWRAILASYPKSLLDGQISVITGFNIPFSLNFPLLKALFLAQKLILFSNIKTLFFFLLSWIISLFCFFLLPFYIPSLFIIKLIHLFLLKFNNFKQNSIYYFSKLYASRFFIFNTTNTIISSSIGSFDKFNHIRVVFFGMHSRNIGAKLLSNYITFKLGQYFTIQEILYPIINDLRTSPRLSGFRITVGGRLTRKERAAFIIKQNGKVTLSNKSAIIDYSSEFKIMKFGVVGIKVWLQKKKTKPYYYKFTFNNKIKVNYV